MTAAPGGVGGPAAPAPALEYVGFWARVVAALIDSAALIALLAVLSSVAWDNWRGPTEGFTGFTINYVVPAIAVLIFWFARGATPGKMAVSAVIVDAKTLAEPTPAQFAVRYVGYYVSTLALGLGLLWVAFDPRKQGWHDKMAGTVVIRRRT